MPITNNPPVVISLGSLDTNFGVDGLTSISIGAGNNQARGIAIQPDGRYVVTGWSDAGGGNYDFAVARFNTDGSLDTSFSGDGKQTTEIAGVDKVYGVALQSDGRIVVAGTATSGIDTNIALARYNTDGSLDTAFNGDGKLTLAQGTGSSSFQLDDEATSVAIQSDGKIIVAGSSYFQYLLLRYNSDGTLDTSFSGDGKVIADFSNNTSQFNAIALQADGKIIAAGYAYNGSYDFGVVRYDTNGNLDTSFNSTGSKIFSFGAYEHLNAISMQADGKILLAGESGSGYSSTDAVLIRLNADGSFDTSFGGGDGIVTLDVSSEDSFNSLVVQADGKILAAGSDQLGYGEALVARFNVDGTLDTSFNGNGVFSTTFGNGTSTVYGMAIASSGQVLAAGDSYTGNYDFGMLRLASGVTDQSTLSGHLFNYTVPANAFYDADGNPLTYSATLENGSPLPSWLAFDTVTRTFSGTPVDGDFGTRQVKVTASDGSASVSASFQLEVSTDFIEALRYTDHARWNYASPNGTTGTSLTFSFMSTAPSYATGNESGTFASMSTAEMQAVRDILQLYHDIAGISFTEVADIGTGGHLRFGTYLQTNTSHAAYAYAPEAGYESSGDVWVNRDFAGYDTPAPGNISYETLLHEIGHSLGLKHPFNDGSNNPPFLTSNVDNTQYTVMSYTDRTDNLFRTVTGPTVNDIHYSTISDSTQMLYDVAAIQFIYGANTLTRTGNNIYTFDPSTPFFETLWDGGGIDAISVSNFSGACVIDLCEGHFSSIRILSDPLPTGFSGGNQPTYLGNNNLTIAFGCIIENATGGNGNDTLIGNAADNILDGGGGNDIINGGAGLNTLIGGTGSDTFILELNSTDTIADFLGGAGQDNLKLADIVSALTNFTPGADPFTTGYLKFFQQGNNSVLRVDSDGAGPQSFTTVAVLQNVSASNIVSANVDGYISDTAPTGSVTITGTAIQNQILAATNSLADIDGLGTISYQWQANNTNITGATNNTYLLTASEVGKTISVVASYTDGHGSAESVSSNNIANISALITPSVPTTSRFTLLGTGANFMDFYVPYGNLSLDGQNIVFKGNSGIDTVYVGSTNDLTFDFTQAGLGVDHIYLSGNWADYSRSYSGSVVILTRTTGGNETIKTISGDSLTFADGTVSVLSALNFLKGAMEPVPAGETSAAFPMSVSPLNNTVRAVVQDASGETIALNHPGVDMIVKGGSGVDVVYVTAGAHVDGTQLGLGQDKMYLTGNWEDYSGTYAGSVVTLTRSVSVDTETVKILGGSASANDSLIFADGTANSFDILNYVKGTATAPILSTAEVTPLGTGDVFVGTAGAESLNGTATGDVLYGHGGADLINGLAGNDTIVITDTGTTAASSATVLFTSNANGTDTVIGFSAAPVASGGDVLDFSAIAHLADSVATGQTLTTDFAANNVFIFDGTAVTITDAANAIAGDVSVVATEGYIVIADSANHNAVSVYHSSDLANAGADVALAILSGVNISNLTAANFLV